MDESKTTDPVRDEYEIQNLMVILGMSRDKASALISAVNKDMGMPRRLRGCK